ncbi:MAG: hypothetical protein H0U23_05550, partial [Blastocatellia bacterium]|nr:hypothetical protein [Blastocatellia bacterium]
MPAVSRAQCLMDGALDPTFDGDGKVMTDFGSGDDSARSVALQPDGKIVAGGNSSLGNSPYFALARYNPNGSLDTTFGSGGKVTTDFGPGDDILWDIVIQPDGKIVAVGSHALSVSPDFALARYNPDGSLDTTFGVGGKVTTDFNSAPNTATAVALQPDGKILVGGWVFFPGATQDFGLARYNPDGTLDLTFDGDGVATIGFGITVPGTDYLYDIALQPDGKIVAVGSYETNFGMLGDFAIARFNPDGTPDTTFSFDGKTTTDFTSFDRALGVALQPDGKIVAIGHRIGSIAQDNDWALARYNPDGTLDTSFGSGGKVTTDFGSDFDSAKGIALQ